MIQTIVENFLWPVLVFFLVYHFPDEVKRETKVEFWMPWIDSRASLLNRKQQQKTQYVKKNWRAKWPLKLKIRNGQRKWLLRALEFRM